MEIVLLPRSFDPGHELTRFSAAQMDAGAIVSFTGVVRNSEAGDLVAMEIEHYPAMTIPAIERIAQDAVARWSLSDLFVLHRHGSLTPGEPIMMVATAARHRAEAFAAAEFMMDFLKSRAPFWKKEITAEGAHWVAGRDVDEDALNRW